ncbi:DUF3261 domain-containing protein [Shewanella corallii]|uniref:DUF3261 domain-containing protein n=1 Tax=Shewanella corallii TaxID=560080 RepID=A0ABT0ND83_9GAMM|nr:DUF3261 domain-containing protein [Shewanella corallii]
MLNFAAFCKSLLLLALLWLSGCSLSPKPSDDGNKVRLAADTFVALPSPASYGGTLTASQLITVSWQQDGKQQSRTLPVQLEVTPEKLALAGFSSWGSRILSLTYEKGQITTAVMPGLGTTLPEPEQVALNLMLTLWPLKAWETELASVNWRLVQHGLTRELLDSNGQPQIEIEYSRTEKLAGPIVFRDKQLGLQITIKTLSQGKDNDA